MPTIEIYRAKINPDDVDRLLEIRATAVAEFQEQVPELVRAELVHVHADEWLDVLVWSEPVDEKRIAEASGCTPAAAEMHSLITEVVDHIRGEIVATTRPLAAAAP